MIALLFVAAVAAVQGASQAEIADSRSSQATQTSEKLVCKKENATGSRVTKRRTCMTVKDWQRVQDATRDDLDVLIRKNTGAVSPTS